jgi:hypothetical protein
MIIARSLEASIVDVCITGGNTECRLLVMAVCVRLRSNIFKVLALRTLEILRSLLRGFKMVPAINASTMATTTMGIRACLYYSKAVA